MAEDTDQKSVSLGSLVSDLLSEFLAAVVHQYNTVSPGRAGRPSTLGPGFTAPPGGPAYLNRTALSWHYYCWAIGYSGEASRQMITALHRSAQVARSTTLH